MIRVSGQQGVRARLLGGLEHAGHGMRIWTSRRAAARSARFAFDDAYRTHGVVFAYMVWTWRWMFTPAVAAGAGGFILLLVASDRPGLIAGGIAALALAVGLYLALRPRLGPD